jgi:nicotinamidase/pyrazinamidase
MKDTEIAVLGVDPQNDFCPGGALPVAEGDQVMKPLNNMFELAKERGWRMALSRDWHPEQTVHFDSWPVHCVAQTSGAEFHPALRTNEITVFSKGMENSDDGYSPFEGVDAQGRSLDQFLEGVKRIFVGGLATDYCVRAAVLDAVKREYEVYLMMDAIRAVDVNPGDGARAILEMKQAGAKLITTEEVVVLGEGI